MLQYHMFERVALSRSCAITHFNKNLNFHFKTLNFQPSAISKQVLRDADQSYRTKVDTSGLLSRFK